MSFPNASLNNIILSKQESKLILTLGAKVMSNGADEWSAVVDTAGYLNAQYALDAFTELSEKVQAACAASVAPSASAAPPGNGNLEKVTDDELAAMFAKDEKRVVAVKEEIEIREAIREAEMKLEAETKRLEMEQRRVTLLEEQARKPREGVRSDQQRLEREKEGLIQKAVEAVKEKKRKRDARRRGTRGGKV